MANFTYVNSQDILSNDADGNVWNTHIGVDILYPTEDHCSPEQWSAQLLQIQSLPQERRRTYSRWEHAYFSHLEAFNDQVEEEEDADHKRKIECDQMKENLKKKKLMQSNGLDTASARAQEREAAIQDSSRGVLSTKGVSATGNADLMQ